MFLSLHHISVKQGSRIILQDINFTIQKKEQWAITGPSGSGKTTLAKVITGQLFYSGNVQFHDDPQPTVLFIEQQHHFRNRSNIEQFYYQQRFNSFDAEDSLTAKEAIEEFTGTDITHPSIRELVQLLHLDTLLDKPIIQLSNGENKRLQIAEAWALQPGLLILDNPFTGLDTEGRAVLHKAIDNISKKTQIILITRPGEIPSCITHIGELNKQTLTCYSVKEYKTSYIKPPPQPAISIRLPGTEKQAVPDDFEYAIKMVNTSVVYHEKKILDAINWQVKKNEHWSISGPNGAGKSTLLSLVTADNPQAYANEIYLFDKRRGKGESIWDIKKKIGYISPEMHLNFEPFSNCFQVAASGLFDTIGLFRQLHDEQEEITMAWMKTLGVDHLVNKSLFQLSLSEQRMLLLARALIKNPPLLVLDEPCQGLDEKQTHFFNALVDTICTQFQTTLLYVTHYRDQLPAVIDHYLELSNGKVVKT